MGDDERPDDTPCAQCGRLRGEHVEVLAGTMIAEPVGASGIRVGPERCWICPRSVYTPER